MKSKKGSLSFHKDIMFEGMMFSIKTFAIICVITSFMYFTLDNLDKISKFFSL